ncbi:MAG: heat-inducible transcriptional repressor HrcA [Gammaproteobacteria bacterium]|nr:heat-inducible transcriptional repressor HrcA [Gammaproteobacteria bacterium]
MRDVFNDQFPGERAQHLLRVLVQRYIREGQPVGSRTLSRDSGLDLSAATIRNVMVDLEEMGFISSPHTSAGRVPTSRGFRFFVDTLLRLKPLSSAEVQSLARRISTEAQDQKSLVASTSAMLSSLTSLAGVVTTPRQPHASLRQIEFLPLSDKRVLAIIVINDQEVQNRILQLDRNYSGEELVRAANYLNEKFAGRELSQVREIIVEELKATRERMNQLMLDAISIAQRAFNQEDQDTFVVAGETNLMGFAALHDVDKLRRLFEAFNAKRDILGMLDKVSSAHGVQIFIGEESGYSVLDDCSLVVAPYTSNDEVIGVLGVIGPTRMAYERVIPIVDVAAKLLGSALNSK